MQVRARGLVGGGPARAAASSAPRLAALTPRGHDAPATADAAKHAAAAPGSAAHAGGGMIED